MNFCAANLLLCFPYIILLKIANGDLNESKSHRVLHTADQSNYEVRRVRRQTSNGMASGAKDAAMETHNLLRANESSSNMRRLVGFKMKQFLLNVHIVKRDKI